MKIKPELRLGAYTVVDLLGKGGMGEVWRARDSKLDRDVAIKVLPETMAREKERVPRFERETLGLRLDPRRFAEDRNRTRHHRMAQPRDCLCKQRVTV